MAEDRFKAIIDPRSDGRFDIGLWEESAMPGYDRPWRPDSLRRFYGVRTEAVARTEAKARRLASKMLADLRRARDLQQRDRIEATR